ncbi:hypothetical protein AALA98_03010 [Lachnospiraceae bacterium 45-W7]
MNHWVKIFQLSRTISRLNFGFLNLRHSIKEQIDIYFVVLLCFVTSIIGVFYYFYFQIIEQLYIGFVEVEMTKLFLRFILSGLSIILAITSSFLLINLFCFSKDVENMQLFPIQPCDIFTSKYIVNILFCYGIELLLLFPFCIVEMQHTGNASVAITYISVAIILPHIIAFPLTVIITVCLKIAMYFRRMRILLSLLGIVIYLSGSVLYKVTSVDGYMKSNITSLNWLNHLFTPFPFYDEYMCLSSVLKLSSTILSIIAVGGYYFLNKFILGKHYVLYGKHQQLNTTKMKYSSSSKLKSYFVKECKIFFRNPVYVINGLFGMIIAPFLLPLSFRISSTADNIEQIRALVTVSEFSFYATLFAIAVITLTSSINVIASSSFSREGANYWITKIVPYTLKQQAFVKILFAVLVSFAGIMINCLIFKLYFHYDFHQIMVIAFISTLFSILWNLIGVFIDMKNPKLEWTNEAEAMKQNLNVILSIIICILVSIGYFFIIAKMIQKNFSPIVIIGIISCSLFVFILIVCRGITLERK